MTTCRCGAQLPTRAGRGRPARYCSNACRQAAYRERALPVELTSRDRWVRRDGKRPLSARGWAASVTKPRSWSSYAAVLASTAGDGVGFVLGDGVGCIDLDHALEGGKVLPWAQAILDRCPATYVEVSMSGTGLHIFGLLPPGPGRGQHGADGIEFYSVGRYIAVSGDRLPGSPSRLADLRDVVATL